MWNIVLHVLEMFQQCFFYVNARKIFPNIHKSLISYRNHLRWIPECIFSSHNSSVGRSSRGYLKVIY